VVVEAPRPSPAPRHPAPAYEKICSKRTGPAVGGKILKSIALSIVVGPADDSDVSTVRSVSEGEDPVPWGAKAAKDSIWKGKAFLCPDFQTTYILVAD